MPPRSRSVSCGRVNGAQERKQSETIQTILSRHFPDQERFKDFNSGNRQSFPATVPDRDIQTYIHHNHLATALDILNTYQRERKTHPISAVPCVGWKKEFTDDSRTRFVEVLKQWLRESASRQEVEEEEVQRYASLCHDLLLEQEIFPARNRRSFIQTLAEVYEQCEEHRKLMLEESLRRDRSCAELLSTARTLSANLLSDSCGFLLVGLTDLTASDLLPSVEAVALWRSLPIEFHGSQPGLPGGVDARLQRSMASAWRSGTGRLVAALLSSPWFVRLLDCRDERVEGGRFAEVHKATQREFDRGNLRGSGLAGTFRQPVHQATRQCFLAVCQTVDDVAFLNSRALMLFHRISIGLGDYGMISLARWLHPLLDELKERVQSLQSGLEQLNAAVEKCLVLPRARGMAVQKPCPSDNMHKRARDAVKRAICGTESHAQKLLRKLDELKARSAPERLQGLRESIGDAYSQIHSVLASRDFRDRVGANFPELLHDFAGQLTASFASAERGALLDDGDSRQRSRSCPASPQLMLDNGGRGFRGSVLSADPMKTSNQDEFDSQHTGMSWDTGGSTFAPYGNSLNTQAGHRSMASLNTLHTQGTTSMGFESCMGLAGHSWIAGATSELQLLDIRISANLERQQGIWYFRVDCGLKGQQPWFVKRRYREFLDLYKRLGERSQKCAAMNVFGSRQSGARFPGKIRLGTTGRALEQRRAELDVWVREAFRRALASDIDCVGPLPLLCRFLDVDINLECARPIGCASPLASMAPSASMASW